MSHIEFYDTYVHNVAIIFYIFDFIKVFRQTDVLRYGFVAEFVTTFSSEPTTKSTCENHTPNLLHSCHEL